MVESVNLLLKGSLLVLHEAAILREEVALLRETNYTFSKRRKTKNKRLQKRGTLTVQDKQALLAEKEGGGQQWQPTATKGGYRKRDETKGRKCGICGKSEHNARTC